MADDPLSARGIGPQPVVARWELWSVATMLVATHGDGAEMHAEAQLQDAEARDHEGDTVVWRGVLTQLDTIRRGT